MTDRGNQMEEIECAKKKKRKSQTQNLITDKERQNYFRQSFLNGSEVIPYNTFARRSCCQLTSEISPNAKS
ncbi:hypothetical protein V1478_005600 [Vespula squamosa]|uniref:Uncharacterized protein n=1 Tax=Vespula squamosa TaxID=30214 RepID=A0ABD2BAF7_VESSQ